MKPGHRSDDEDMYELYMRKHHFEIWFEWLMEKYQRTNKWY